jgi:lysophospholipase L1-like esterase
MKGTILCFGDSNTYGYDPRLGGEGRFPEDVRWTGILKKTFQCRVENYGVCGRCIPCTDFQIRYARAQLQDGLDREAPIWIWIMLGTNDLLQGRNVTAPDVALRMKAFLESLMDTGRNLLLIAPPKMQPGAWVAEERLVRESQKLGVEYRKVAEELGIRFVDAGQWEIALTFDGVHFSEEGHRMFAQEIAKAERQHLGGNNYVSKNE